MQQFSGTIKEGANGAFEVPISSPHTLVLTAKSLPEGFSVGDVLTIKLLTQEEAALSDKSLAHSLLNELLSDE